MSRAGGGDEQNLSVRMPFDLGEEFSVGLGSGRMGLGECRCRRGGVVGNRAEKRYPENSGEVRWSGDRPPDQPHDARDECCDDRRYENSTVGVPCDESEDEDGDTEGGQAGPDDGRFDRADPVERTRGAGGGSADGESAGFTLPSWTRELGIVIALLALIFGATPLLKTVRNRKLSRRLAQGDIEAAWADITGRLADLGETIDPARTPLEAASDIDDAFVPLARTYGDTIDGDHDVSTAVINRATDEQLMAHEHISTRYSRLERLKAAYRPTKLIDRYQQFRSWLAIRNGS